MYKTKLSFKIGTIHVKDDKDVGKLSKGSLFSFRTLPSTEGGCKNCEDLVARPTRGASWLSSWPSARRIECLKQNSQWRTECAREILDEMKMWGDDGKHTSHTMCFTNRKKKSVTISFLCNVCCDWCKMYLVSKVFV